MKTIRLTMAQALVKYLCAQHTEIDGVEVPLFAGTFGIFGHGNVTCLSEALEQGWRLYGSPIITWDHEAGCMKAAQAVVWKDADVIK